jgi:hypothetical protein
MRSDKEILREVARQLRKRGGGEADRAAVLIDWLAEDVDVFRVPPREP